MKTLQGHIKTIRKHKGLTFIDLCSYQNDGEHIIQVTYKGEESFTRGSFLRIHGDLICRPEIAVRQDLGKFGAFEFKAEHIEIISVAKPLPIDETSDEEVAIQHRPLQLRFEKYHKMLHMRHLCLQKARASLVEQGFWEIETPAFTLPSPEGAKEFLIKDHPFALSQSPQQYKQMLMVAGVQKYFQFAKCFRDEGSRTDRQPEFTQIDIEMAFVSKKDVMHAVETTLRAFSPIPLPETVRIMTWKEAMTRFGSDKPDTRFGLELQDFDGLFPEKFVRGFTIPTIPRKLWSEFKDCSVVRAEDNLKIVVRGDDWEEVSHKAGLARTAAIRLLQLKSDEHHWLWISDFPLFEKSESGFKARHHPFTRPIKAHESMLLNKEQLLEITAEAYDLVLDGCEVGGGSIRIHEPALQKSLFSVIGADESCFKAILQAFEYGVPEHGGFAFGFDRLLMLFTGAKTIREVIAFPKI